MQSDRDCRGGLKLAISKTPYSKVGKMMPFRASGPKLWNALAVFISNLKCNSVEEFKQEIDKYLTGISDIPRVGYSSWVKNSIIDIWS